MKEAYEDTDVGSAFGDESHDSEWRVVSIRIAPCSPLGSHFGDRPSQLCWPEVRLILQPVIHDHHIGWKTVDAFSDDRAIHALYHVFEPSLVTQSRHVVEQIKQRLGETRGDVPQSCVDFERLRDASFRYLLDEVYALRDQTLTSEPENCLQG